MHLHKVRNQRLGALQGIAVVLGIVAAALADALVFKLLEPLIGPMASTLSFYAVGAILALWVMRRYVLSYSYYLTESLLRISYAYGRYERLLIDLYLNNLLACGTLEDMRARYPNARVTRAALKSNPLETLCVACRDDGKPALYVIQPDEEIREAILRVVREKKKK